MSALGELAGIYAGFSACPPSANSGHRIACRYIPFENPDAAILFFGPHQDLPQVQLRHFPSRARHRVLGTRSIGSKENS